MKIELNGTHNTRDLGGLKSLYGTVKYGKLLRSGELSRIDEADSQKLLKHDLTRVIDLRTEAERSMSPDALIKGVEYVVCPIIESTTFGITYEKSGGQEVSEMLKRGIERLFARNETPEEHMQLLYSKFVTDPYSINGYKNFFNLLLEGKSGATLWHCSAGKDRVGTCTALLLSALKVDREQIYEDYMYTNISGEGNTHGILDKVRPYIPDDKLFGLVNAMLRVDASYLDTFFDKIDGVYKSTELFLSDALELDGAKLDRLRTLYIDC